MDLAVAILSVLIFVTLFGAFRVVDRSAEVVASSRRAVADLRDRKLSDDDKEIALQAHAKQLFGLFFAVTAGATLALLAPLGIVWSLDRLGFVSLDAVARITLSWPFLLVSAVVVTLAMLGARMGGRVR